MHPHKGTIFIITIALMSLTKNANANEPLTPLTLDVSKNLYVQTGGYTQLKVDTNLEQKYPLLEVRSLEMPPTIKYIGQGLNYMLSLSGYRLSPLKGTDAETLSLYSMKVPLTNRTFTTASTLQVVQTLVGVGFDVEVNEVSRTVQIKAKENK